jgi:hypothetical protein
MTQPVSAAGVVAGLKLAQSALQQLMSAPQINGKTSKSAEVSVKAVMEEKTESAHKGKATKQKAKTKVTRKKKEVSPTPQGNKRTFPKKADRFINLRQWVQMPDEVLRSFQCRFDQPGLEGIIKAIETTPYATTPRGPPETETNDPIAANQKLGGMTQSLIMIQLPFNLLNNRFTVHHWMDLLLGFHEGCIRSETRCGASCPFMQAVPQGHRVQALDIRVRMQSSLDCFGEIPPPDKSEDKGRKQAKPSSKEKTAGKQPLHTTTSQMDVQTNN